MLLVRSDIPAKLRLVDIDFESFFIGLDFWNKKWRLNCSYNPITCNIELHLNCLSESMDAHSSKYENSQEILIHACSILQWKCLVKLTSTVVLLKNPEESREFIMHQLNFDKKHLRSAVVCNRDKAIWNQNQNQNITHMKIFIKMKSENPISEN